MPLALSRPDSGAGAPGDDDDLELLEADAVELLSPLLELEELEDELEVELEVELDEDELEGLDGLGAEGELEDELGLEGELELEDDEELDGIEGIEL